MNHLKIKKNAIMMAMLIIFFSCNKEDAFKLFDLALSNQLVINVANIQVIDAAMPSNVISNNDITVAKVGEGQERIYDMGGWKDLRYANSFISVGVPPRDNPTKTNPLKFSVLIKHKNPNYLPQIVTMSIFSNQIENRIVRLIKTNQKGIKLDNTPRTHTQSTACTSAAQMSFSNTFDPLQRKTTVTIPEGTAFKDKAGNLLCGAIEGDLISFDPSDRTPVDTSHANILTLFPGGLVYNAKHASWQAVNRGVFTVYDFFSLHITVGGKEAYSFSKPAEVSIDKNDSVFCLRQDILRPLSNNDYIPIWSPNDSMVWNPETMAKVENNKVIFKIGHTGWWSVSDPSCRNLFDWFERKFIDNSPKDFSPCPPCGNMKIKISIDTNVNSSYYTEISLANNPGMIVASPNREYRNGLEFSLEEYLGVIERNTKINFKIYRKEPWNSNAIVSKSITMICTEITPLNLTDPNYEFPQYVRISTNFTMKCTGASGIESITPTASIYAKEIENGKEAITWDYMGIIRNGVGTTEPKLQGDKRYKFAIFPNSSYEFTTDMIQIDQLEGAGWQENVKSIKIPPDIKSPIMLRFRNTAWNLDEWVTVRNTGHKHYSLNMDWTPSARTCEGYKRRL